MKLRFSVDVPHMCPKLGKLIIIDTSKTKTCLSCSFAVHKLVIKSHPWLKFVMAANFAPLAFVSMMLFYSDVPNLHILGMTLPMHGIPFFAGRWLIEKNNVSFYKTSLQELRNWNARV